MKSNKHTIIPILKKQLEDNISWSKKLSTNHFSLHLAIFQEPYLTFIMEGKKKIETRFAKRACPPFERVSDGDVVLLKESGGKVSGICEVEQVWFYHLDPKAFEFIKSRFGKLICAADNNFWTERECKTVATLMLIKNVMPITGVEIVKRDRRGWVVFEDSKERLLL